MEQRRTYTYTYTYTWARDPTILVNSGGHSHHHRYTCKP
ncbi:hypothetical protein L1278_001773 [Pontibacter sp. HSC-36F09]|nr:hypothetical protein [Pontibacter sp. HSC-36F09]